MSNKELALIKKMNKELNPKQQQKALAKKTKHVKYHLADGEYFYDRTKSFPYQEELYFAKLIKNKSHLKAIEFYGDPADYNGDQPRYVRHYNWNEKFFQKQQAKYILPGLVPTTPKWEKQFQKLLTTSELVQEHYADDVYDTEDAQLKRHKGICDLCGDYTDLRSSEYEGEKMDLCDTCATSIYNESLNKY